MDLERRTAARRIGRHPTTPFSVIVADPDPLARAFLVVALRANHLLVSAEAETLVEAIEAVGRLSPRLLILAATFPGVASTQEAIREVHRSARKTAVVITELPGAHLDPVPAFQAGAAGYLVKDADMHRWLAPMLRRYARDDVTPLSAGVSEALIRTLQDSQTAADSDAGNPSHRETEVLGLVGKGLTNDEIAQVLNVGSSTVKTHVHHLLRKLRLSNRVLLALYAREAEPVKLLPAHLRVPEEP